MANAALIDVAGHVGYPLVFVLVGTESTGVPVPGETALILAALAANAGRLQIEFVIALAAAGAIVGDNIGYVIGRKGGRWILERPGRFRRRLAPAQPHELVGHQADRLLAAGLAPAGLSCEPGRACGPGPGLGFPP